MECVVHGYDRSPLHAIGAHPVMGIGYSRYSDLSGDLSACQGVGFCPNVLPNGILIFW